MPEDPKPDEESSPEPPPPGPDRKRFIRFDFPPGERDPAKIFAAIKEFARKHAPKKPTETDPAPPE